MISQNAVVRKKMSYTTTPLQIVEDKTLSANTRLCLVWALGRPENWEFRIRYMCKLLGFTDHSWRKVRNEMIVRGFFIQNRSVGNGKIEWHNVFTDAPLFKQSIPYVEMQQIEISCLENQHNKKKKEQKNKIETREQQLSPKNLVTVDKSISAILDAEKSPPGVTTAQWREVLESSNVAGVKNRTGFLIDAKKKIACGEWTFHSVEAPVPGTWDLNAQSGQQTKTDEKWLHGIAFSVIEKNARPGETYEMAAIRLGREKVDNLRQQIFQPFDTEPSKT